MITAIILALCISRGIATTQDAQHKLIGWQGESFDADYVFGENYGETGPVQISKQPLAYLWKSFITRAEAQHIAKLAAPRLKRSGVGGEHKAGEARTSYGTFIPRFQDKIVARVEQRVSRWVGLPVVYQEEIQVLRYEPGQQYRPHMDANGRMATVLIYLAEPAGGGETAFPQTSDGQWLDPALKPEGLSPDCAEGHVAVKPEYGAALLFYSMPPGADADEGLRVVDPFSEHTGCPPSAGVKWTATIWVHFDAFRPDVYLEQFRGPMADLSNCADQTPQCTPWAKMGECDNNAEFMLGTAAAEGHCRLACGLCQPCDDGDGDCISRSREALGYLNISPHELTQILDS
eukprot:jgi/Ulvmu1/7738/UM039_0046.1